jgi:8-oxo-dGTP pyrophosphatase MutT (NUDIX family)
MDRHFTVSGFVVHEARTALHWHRKLDMWLPAGGHVELGEDPVQAVLREVHEELSVEAEVMHLRPNFAADGGPTPIQPPYVIQDCLVEPGHFHVDFVYFLHLTGGYPGRSYDAASPIVWFSEEDLRAGGGEHDGQLRAFTADVRNLGIEAIRVAATQPVAP